MRTKLFIFLTLAAALSLVSAGYTPALIWLAFFTLPFLVAQLYSFSPESHRYACTPEGYNDSDSLRGLVPSFKLVDPTQPISKGSR